MAASHKPARLRVGNIGIMDKKMETTRMGYIGFRVGNIGIVYGNIGL